VLTLTVPQRSALANVPGMEGFVLFQNDANGVSVGWHDRTLWDPIALTPDNREIFRLTPVNGSWRHVEVRNWDPQRFPAAWKAFTEAVDAHASGGHWAPNGGYFDAHGGYTNAMRNYASPGTVITDVVSKYKALRLANGGYFDDKGGYRDAMGNYTDPAAVAAEVQSMYRAFLGGPYWPQ
jgi:hypothetical protein